MSWSVKRGTDRRFPSVVITIDGYQSGRDKTDERHIQVVFRREETVNEMRQVIQQSVVDYVREYPRGPRLALELAQGVLNLTGVE